MSAEENISGVMELLKSLKPEQHDYLNRYLSNTPRWVLESVQVLKKGKDTVFVEENTPADYIYILADGIVRAIDYRFQGVAYEYMWFYAVKTFGTMETMLNIPLYMTTLKTVTPCAMLVLPRTVYEKWIWKDSNAVRMEVESMGLYLLEQSRVGRAYLFLQGMDRLLFMFAHSYEQKKTDGDMILNMTRQELAERNGISIKTTNRAVKKMEEEGFIGRSGRKITVTHAQYEKMKAYLQPLESRA